MMEESRSSLVELTTVEEIVNMSRILRDEIEALEEMLDAYNKGELREISRLYERVRSLKNRGEELKVRVLEYLVKSYEVVMYSSNYVNIVKLLEGALQQLDGAAYRILLAKENKVDIDSETLELFRKVLKFEKDQATHLENSVSKLTVAPKTSLEDLTMISKIEEEIDMVFRRGLLEIYNKHSNHIAALLVLKDVLEHIENASDFMKLAGEEVRYLALVRIAA
ncbi:MAG: DUF47 family protein [Desulfurococcaceae archaeon]